jgi:hypothetical protein
MVVVVDEPSGRTYGCPKCKVTLDIEISRIEVSGNGHDD